ncbi:hypothetical protein [Tsukamurella serpentis]
MGLHRDPVPTERRQRSQNNSSGAIDIATTSDPRPESEVKGSGPRVDSLINRMRRNPIPGTDVRLVVELQQRQPAEDVSNGDVRIPPDDDIANTEHQIRRYSGIRMHVSAEPFENAILRPRRGEQPAQ